MARPVDDGPGESTLAHGGDCLVWRKSTRSIGNGQCVEAAQLLDGRLALRDSTDKLGPMLVLSQESWQALIQRAKIDYSDIA
jgi:hypothetical protein